MSCHSGLVTLPELSDPSKDHMNVTVMISLISEVDLGKQRWEFGGLIDLSIFFLGIPEIFIPPRKTNGWRIPKTMFFFKRVTPSDSF